MALDAARLQHLNGKAGVELFSKLYGPRSFVRAAELPRSPSIQLSGDSISGFDASSLPTSLTLPIPELGFMGHDIATLKTKVPLCRIDGKDAPWSLDLRRVQDIRRGVE